MSKFVEGLRSLINECSLENGSNTPDYIIAGYIINSIAALDTAIQMREEFYGRKTQEAEKPPEICSNNVCDYCKNKNLFCKSYVPYCFQGRKLSKI